MVEAGEGGRHLAAGCVGVGIAWRRSMPRSPVLELIPAPRPCTPQVSDTQFGFEPVLLTSPPHSRGAAAAAILLWDPFANPPHPPSIAHDCCPHFKVSSVYKMVTKYPGPERDRWRRSWLPGNFGFGASETDLKLEGLKEDWGAAEGSNPPGLEMIPPELIKLKLHANIPLPPICYQLKFGIWGARVPRKAGRSHADFLLMGLRGDI